MEGSSHGLIYGNILVFAWRDKGKPKKSSGKIANFQAKT
jgi:hypothetical protein